MKKPIDYGHWTFKTPMQKIQFDEMFKEPAYLGMVYKITHIPSQRYYFGKKTIKSKRKIRGKRVWRSSNWRKYRSSSKALQAFIESEGEDRFKFEVVKLCSNKRDLAYEEALEIMSHIRDESCINELIALKVRFPKPSL